ncbi:MAG: NUDIX domain-containing protein [Chloroflexi bacterium]|nr:MAG: NUDIX domain-containing protein [Chloroflexota bacterium]
MSYIDWIRSKVGHRKIFLVYGTVIVVDENGRFLLQHRTDFDFWGLPGGVLELDEDIETCARRELLEETGLTVGGLSLVGVYTDPTYDVVYPNGDAVQQFTICFVGQMNGGQLQSDGVEASAHRFVEVAETAVYPMPIWYKTMLHDWQTGNVPAFLPANKNGQLVDQIKNVRSFIGTDRLIAVGAMVVVQRDDDTLLMIQRRDTGTWAFPSGYSDLGENVAETAVREAFEETGYHIQVERLIGIYSNPQFHYKFENGDQVKNVGVVFKASLNGGVCVPDPAETLAVKWWAVEEILPCMSKFFYPLAEQIINHLDDGVFVI